MKRRCINPFDSAYPNYGGRGISVCDRWMSFENFLADMGERPPGLTIERIDNEQGYSPENCRWASIKEQLRNQRRNRKIEHLGVTMIMADWAEAVGIKADTLAKRLERMGPQRALTPGLLRKKWKHGTRAGYEYHGCRCFECTQSNNARHRLQRAKRKERKL
jgi:hypothetical protein